MSPVVLDLNRVVTEIDKMLRRLIGEDIDLVLVRDPTLGRIKTDRGQVEQILMNLVVNARDAMPNGGTLTIETANATLTSEDLQRYPFVEEGPYVMLNVADTGCGMDEETQCHIFEPFYTTKPLGQGTGLGLSMVYGIVKQSGGYILVDSQPNKGARFRLYFPQVTDALEPARVGMHKTLPGGSENILVVEDEPALRALTRTFLEVAGYTVVTANSGEAAFEAALGGCASINMLLTDLILPGMSGRVLADRLKMELPDIRVLYMSGYTDDLVSKNGIVDRDASLLHKPFTMESLLSKVREVLDAECLRG